MEDSSNDRENRMQSEPTVLDWFKSVLRLRPIPIPESTKIAEMPALLDLQEEIEVQHKAAIKPIESIAKPFNLMHLRLPAAILLALIAQVGLERHPDNVIVMVMLYIIAAGLAGWVAWTGDLRFEPTGEIVEKREEAGVRPLYLAFGFILALLTFISANDDSFDSMVLISWFGSLLFMLMAFWEGGISLRPLAERIGAWFRKPGLQIRIDSWGLLLLGVFAVSAYFRFAYLDTVPIEMWSDQAEKLLDVVDVLNGQYPIYFVRNTGREALQFYLAAATAILFKTGISFLTLKIGTALAGFVTLFYLYLFAREIGGRKVGLAAVLLAGIAFWPNVISRAGLRFPLLQLFAAPAMYYLVRGLRRKSRNDFLLCGMAVGLGLNGYSSARVLPLVVMLGVIIYIFHRESRSYRWRAIGWLCAAGAIGLVILIPLLRVAIEMPDLFLFRMMSRVATAERDLPGSPLAIFGKNFIDALLMFNWDDGEIWIIGPIHRPALDWITAALFQIGVVTLLVRYIRRRAWQDLYTLLSIPVLLLASTLSLAFPAENPALNRASGVIIPVFTIAAIPFAAFPDWARRTLGKRKGCIAGLGVVAVLFMVAAGSNYRITFEEYAEQLERSAWNTGDAGRTIKGYVESIGSYDTAHVVAFPYWMDTRLVGIHAGQPTRDYAIWPDELDQLADETRNQLFIVNPNDEEGIERLHALFPSGITKIWRSPVEGHDFIIYFVPEQASLD